MRALFNYASLGALLASAPARAELLQHDDLVDGTSAALQLGMCEHECAASVFTVEDDFELRYVYFLAGPTAYNVFYDLWVTEVDGSGAPDRDRPLVGVPSYDLDYVPISAYIQNYSFAEIDFAYNGVSSVPFAAGESFAVGLCPYELEDYPPPYNTWGLGTDVGLDAPDENWIYAVIDGLPTDVCDGSTYVWFKNSQLGVGGDWAIRASDTPWDGTTPGDDDTSDDDASDDDASDDDASDDDAAAALELDTIVPSSGVEGETTTFTLAGTGFGEGTEIYFGGLLVTDLIVQSDRGLTGTVPSALPVGVHDVTARNPSGEQDSLPRAFEQLAPDGVESSCKCQSAGTAPGAAAVLALLLGSAARRRRA